MNRPNPASARKASPQAGPSPTAGSAASSPTRAEFSRTFDRCFDRVYAYVTRRVDERAVCERIVREVLEANLEILVDGDDDERSIRSLKRSSDERIEVAGTAKASAVVESPLRTDGSPARAR